MQVNQVTDTITHAVIGNQESVEMGVSDSAALMHIFSTALYTYPTLATVREIMCNGWDAHISAGITDTPLDVTITATHVTIRDFGFGIPHAKIGPIYGVFGDSTKRDDSTTTGGFGLGSKAPFAYVDDFEVISCHEGVKTVYVMSKSSMEVGGKPSIKPIISVPTEEQGIQVKFALKPGHYDKFVEHIREVRTLGQIPTRVNGVEQTDHLPLLESPTGYIISSFQGTNTQRINLRYGNVVYPIPTHEAYAIEWEAIQTSMRNLWHTANVIFMAPPNTVTIAPSRETLILTDGTIKTIKALLAKFDSKASKSVDQAVKEMTNHEANKAVKEQAFWGSPIGKVFPAALKQIGNQHSSGAYAYTVKRAGLHYAVANRPAKLGEEDGVFVDCHTRTVRQSVGSLVFMNESLVDHNRSTECSNGLHVARRDYLHSFSGDVMVLAKLAPEDVIAVPHGDARKLRARAYHIIALLSKEDAQAACLNKPISDTQLLGNAVAGKHIGVTNLVEILNQKKEAGSIKYTNVEGADYVQEESGRVATSLDHVETEGLQASSVDARELALKEVPKYVAEEVVEAVKPVVEAAVEKAVVKATGLQAMKDAYQSATTPEALRDASQALLDHKAKVKKSWTALGIGAAQVEKMKEAAQYVAPVVSKPVAKKSATKPSVAKPVATKTATAKASPLKGTKIPAGKNTFLSDLYAQVLKGDKVAAKTLLKQKQTKKKGWVALGLPANAGDVVAKLLK